jgi:beta-galactosidase/beta-glucuronidase
MSVLEPPRPEHPRPTLTRSHWLNLNGDWRFEADANDVGMDQGWFRDHNFSQTIVVPFSAGSPASGIEAPENCDVVWYQRSLDIKETWLKQALLLHFGAVDHWAEVYINGHQVGQHRGGYTPFSIEISAFVNAGSNLVTVRVADSPRWSQPRGKQAGTTKWPIDYDPIIGIWQTVWLEPVPKTYINDVWCHYQLQGQLLTLHTRLSDLSSGTIKLDLLHDGKLIATHSEYFDQRLESRMTFKVDNPALWSPQSPTLYNLKISFEDKACKLVDEVNSYTGLREITIENNQQLLNGKPIYLRGVLDQGYFEQGWYTPPNDTSMVQDIQLTLDMGFNCVRKHQKAEDPRFLFLADQMGLLVWAEMPSGRIFSDELITTLTDEWLQLVQRDRAHPCIITWVPFNESWGIWHQAERAEQRAFVDGITSLTRALDNTRPIVGNDGWQFSSGDLWTLHLYETKTETIAERLKTLLKNPLSEVIERRSGALPCAQVSGLPILLTECGGIGFVEHPAGDEFTYGTMPKDSEALELRFKRIAEEINRASELCGFVWTQLTDVQQETNGVLYFDRTPKIPIGQIKKIIESIGQNTQNRDVAK